MENSTNYDDKGQYWLDKIANEKPSWFKITKDLIKSFINGETVELDKLEVSVENRWSKKLTIPYDIALSKYTHYKNGGFYKLSKGLYKEIDLTGKEIEALYKLHMANKKEVA